MHHFNSNLFYVKKNEYFSPLNSKLKNNNMKTNNTTLILASAGALGGLYYAFKKGKGFWGYAGFFALGSIAGHLAGNIVTAVIPQPKAGNSKSTTTTEITEETSNASGQQIGSTACTSPNNSLCQQKCEDLGGVFNSSGDRKCYKNGIAITTPPFGNGGRASTLKVVRQS